MDDAITSQGLPHAAATITDDDLDYIWQMQELLMARRIGANGEVRQSLGTQEATVVDEAKIVLLLV